MNPIMNMNPMMNDYASKHNGDSSLNNLSAQTHRFWCPRRSWLVVITRYLRLAHFHWNRGTSNIFLWLRSIWIKIKHLVTNIWKSNTVDLLEQWHIELIEIRTVKILWLPCTRAELSLCSALCPDALCGPFIQCWGAWDLSLFFVLFDLQLALVELASLLAFKIILALPIASWTYYLQQDSVAKNNHMHYGGPHG